MSLDFAKEPDQSPEPEALPGVRVVGDPVALLTALAEARADFDTAGFNREGQSGNQKFKYADIGTLRDATYKALSAHGVSLTMFPCGGSVYGWRLPYVLAGHGAQIWGEAMAPALELKEVKSSGALVSYHERYVFQAVVGIKGQEPELDDLPELNSGALDRRGQRQPPSPRQRQAPAAAPQAAPRAEPQRQPPPAAKAPQAPPEDSRAAFVARVAEEDQKRIAAIQAKAPPPEPEPEEIEAEPEPEEQDPAELGPMLDTTRDAIKRRAQEKNPASMPDAIAAINGAFRAVAGKDGLRPNPATRKHGWDPSLTEGEAREVLRRLG